MMKKSTKKPTEEMFYEDSADLFRDIDQEKQRGGLEYISVSEAAAICEIFREEAATNPTTDALLKTIEAAFLLGYRRGRAKK